LIIFDTLIGIEHQASGAPVRWSGQYADVAKAAQKRSESTQDEQ